MIISTLKRIFNYKFHVKPFINPFIGLQISSLGDFPGVTEVKRDVPIIISLTSYEERFKELPIALYSLLNQSLKPDRIILWLSDELKEINNLPYDITQFIKNGLEIRFVKDIGSYTKAIYAFKEFPDSIIVTADDDIYYSKDWLKKLYLSYIAHPEDIHVHRAHRVDLNKKYDQWKKHVKDEDARYDNFLTGVGGVLYPEKCFSKEVLRDDIFLKYAPTSDDIWFWLMALVNKRKIRVVKNHIKTLLTINFCNQIWGKTLYKINKFGKNDQQLKNLMIFYGKNILSKLG